MIVPPPLPPDVPAFVIASCPSDSPSIACYDAATNTIYLRTPDKFTREHELGHAADVQLMDDGERSRFMRVLGLLQLGWISAKETFADAYATCRLRYRPQGTWEQVSGPGTGAYNPKTDRRQEGICRLITRALSD